jgi:gamma-glutamyltranspeptidase/glutathione hydrolase
MVAFGPANSPSNHMGGEHLNLNPAHNGNDDPLVLGLRALGHTVNTAAQSSGIGTIVLRCGDTGTVFQGGADPRREGVVLGDTF